MDPDFNIYEGDPDEIPDEDKARLEGYLKGRAEGDQAKHEALLRQLKRERSDEKGTE